MIKTSGAKVNSGLKNDVINANIKLTDEPKRLLVITYLKIIFINKIIQ